MRREHADAIKDLLDADDELQERESALAETPDQSRCERFRTQVLHHAAFANFSSFECFIRDLLIEDVLRSGRILGHQPKHSKHCIVAKDLAPRLKCRLKDAETESRKEQERIRCGMAVVLNRCRKNFQSPNTASEIYVEHFRFAIRTELAELFRSCVITTTVAVPILQRSLRLLRSIRHAIAHNEGGNTHPEYRAAFNACRGEMPEALVVSKDVREPREVLEALLTSDCLKNGQQLHQMVLHFSRTILFRLYEREDELSGWLDSLRADPKRMKETNRKYKRDEKQILFAQLGRHWK